jgi:hypothetical protein
METERQKRIEFLARRSAGERQRPAYIEKLAKLLRKPHDAIRFIALETSDEVRINFSTMVQADEKSKASVDVKRASWDLLCHALRSLREGASDRELYVFLPGADCVGALPLGEKDFLSHAVTLYREFKESVYATDPLDHGYGIIIDYNDDFYHGTEDFEATFYGSARNLLLVSSQGTGRSGLQ